jgi:hypothetical protein
MKALRVLTACAAYLATPALVISAEPSAPIDDQVRINHRGPVGEEDASRGELCVLDGELMFVAFLVNRKSPGGPGDPPLRDYSLHFRWVGHPFSGPGKLRVKMAPRNLLVDREGKFPKEFLEKDGWYVTADLSTDPPQVILTEKPREESRWVILKADYPGRYLFKNPSAPGEAVCLTIEKEG